jgi:uncharacterized protein (TIGR03083 family)
MSGPSASDFRGSIAVDASRIAELADQNPDAAVPSCPGWDVARLAGHVGRVHRMTIGVLTNTVDGFADPSTLEKPPSDPSLAGVFVRDGATELDSLLAVREMDSPCWNFLDEPAFARFWFRRQCHETAVHRFDAELALDRRALSTAPASLAVDGIDEYFVIVGKRLLPERSLTSFGGTVHLHATDIEGEWMIDLTAGVLTVTHGHGKGDAAIRGSGADLFLGLWGRIDLRADDRYERFGSADVIDSFASMGGT